jgi:hypothetical protein
MFAIWHIHVAYRILISWVMCYCFSEMPELTTVNSALNLSTVTQGLCLALLF